MAAEHTAAQSRNPAANLNALATTAAAAAIFTAF
jgi:hypothetical protein